jgi:hypothetical protein
MMLSVPQPQMVEWWMNDEWRIRKDFVGSGLGLMEVLLVSQLLDEGTEENHENIPAEIRTRHLPNKSLESFP